MTLQKNKQSILPSSIFHAQSSSVLWFILSLTVNVFVLVFVPSQHFNTFYLTEFLINFLIISFLDFFCSLCSRVRIDRICVRLCFTSVDGNQLG